MGLLEREAATAALRRALDLAAAGRGTVVLVTGEAGAGKTALLHHVEGLSSLPWSWGWCDPLPTPVPFAPWRDVADDAGLPDLTTAGPDVGRRLLTWLRGAGPRVLVIEDAHWADDASAAVLRSVARRLAGLPVVLVVTAREEGPPDVPARRALMELAGTPGVVLVPVPALSPPAVATLAAGTGHDPGRLHELTGGNAFLVVATVSSPPGPVPRGAAASVADRVASLSGPAQAVVAQAAVMPGRAPLELLGAPGRRDALDEAVLAGLLDVEAGSVRFRHELVRLAVLGELPPMRRAALHAAALAALSRLPGTDHATLAHHADGAHDPAAAVHHHTAAADRAAVAVAHHQAVEHLEAALERRHVLPPLEQARLLRRLSEEQHVLRGSAAAAPPAARAVQILREQGAGPLALGDALTWAARVTPDAAAGSRTLDEALALLEPRGTTPELAAAYALRATLLMLSRQLGPAQAATVPALKVARAAGHAPSTQAALQALGCSRLLGGDAGGADDLRKAVGLALAHGLEAEAGRAWSNLVSAAGEACLYTLVEPAAEDALRFLSARDLDGPASYVRAWRARCLLERGRWDDAADVAGGVLDAPVASDIAVLLALTVRGRVRARRGDPGVAEPLDAALERARATGLLQRLAPVAAARAEARWLSGRVDDGRDGLLQAYGLAREVGHAWAVGELGLQVRRHGLGEVEPDEAAEPYRLHLRGELRAAARAWDAVGRPYEAADALADSDRTDDVQDALARFAALGARPARERAARRLRERGVRHLPRGPRPAARQDPFGLTARQQEVYALIRRGRTDPEIAAELHLSVKTVGHHVSAVLHKTGATSRRSVPATAEDGEDLPMTPPRPPA